MSQGKESSLLDLILCPMCHFVMSSPSRDPMIFTKCGHTICVSCLSKVYCCPVCYSNSTKAHKNTSTVSLVNFAYKANLIPQKYNPIDITASDTEDSSSFNGQPSEFGPLCTFSKYPNTCLIQKFYHCEDCKLVGELGCCEACAKRCHIGHRVFPDQRNQQISTICNCGAHTLEKVKCFSCSHKHELCTFLKTGKNYIFQDFYHCLTCGITDGYGLCGACARNCHHDHEVIYSGIVNSFCDCKDFHKCMCQT